MPPQPPLRAPHLSCPVLGALPLKCRVTQHVPEGGGSAGESLQPPGKEVGWRGPGLCPAPGSQRPQPSAPPSSTAGTVGRPQLQVPCQLFLAQPGLGCPVGRGRPHTEHSPGPFPRPKNLPIEGSPPQPSSPRQGSWVTELQATDKAERSARRVLPPFRGQRSTRRKDYPHLAVRAGTSGPGWKPHLGAGAGLGPPGLEESGGSTLPSVGRNQARYLSTRMK